MLPTRPLKHFEVDDVYVDLIEMGRDEYTASSSATAPAKSFNAWPCLVVTLDPPLLVLHHTQLAFEYSGNQDPVETKTLYPALLRAELEMFMVPVAFRVGFCGNIWYCQVSTWLFNVGHPKP